jgi:hypothetical protein
MMTFILCCLSILLTQGAPTARSSGQGARPIGAIIKLDAAAHRITIKSDAGPEMTITFDDSTRYLRVAPGAQDLQNAAAISLSDLTVGDRILARGQNASESGSFKASSIIVMTKEDLSKKHAAELAEWETRGVGGVITALSPDSKEITISIPSAAGAKPMLISLAPGAILRRHAPSSVKFSDALPSRFEDLKVGDQVKALGTSNEDRSRYMAEQLVSGSFRTVGAMVVSTDVAKSTIIITDLSTNKRMQVQVTSDSTMRRLSSAVVQMLAARIQGSKSPGESSGSGQPPKTLQSAIEELPPLGLASLKPGDALILSCTKDADPSKALAVTLLAGVEPLFTTSSNGARTLNLGLWNLDLNIIINAP